MWILIFIIILSIEVFIHPRIDIDIGNKQILLWFTDLDDKRKYTKILWW